MPWHIDDITMSLPLPKVRSGPEFGTELEEVKKRCKKISEENISFDVNKDVSLLVVPTVSSVNDSRFPRDGKYVYVRRAGPMGKLVELVRNWANSGQGGMLRNILGFKRCGKSYTLATFVCYLRNNDIRVLYIHQCRFWALDPLGYLKKEAIATFHGDEEMQKQIDAASELSEVVKMIGDKQVVVVADQVGALYEKELSTDGVLAKRYSGSPVVVEAILRLSGLTLVITAASARKTTAFVDCFNNCDQNNTIPFFDGFTGDEFQTYRLRVPAYRGMDDADVFRLERLTGFLPGLLSLPRGDAFKLHPDVMDLQNVDVLSEVQSVMLTFMAGCCSGMTEKHSRSHEAAVFGRPYNGNEAEIDFDVVSLPGENKEVSCPSLFCKDVLSDYMAEANANHKMQRLQALYAYLDKVKQESPQEPTKVGDAVEDCLIAFMQVHKKCPMQIPLSHSTALGEKFRNYIPLNRSRTFDSIYPAPMDLKGDYDVQARSAEPTAIAYFPSGKFLRYIDFVVRVFIKNGHNDGKHQMLIVVGQITFSRPVDHAHTWRFFQEDYVQWMTGYNGDQVDTQFILAWFTPHAKPELDQFEFTNESMTGETLNVSFDSFKPIDGDLDMYLSPLRNENVFKPCACRTGCPATCGCRKTCIPCRSDCACQGSGPVCQNKIEWLSEQKQD